MFGDLADLEKLDHLFDGNAFDAVMHFASHIEVSLNLLKSFEVL